MSKSNKETPPRLSANVLESVWARRDMDLPTQDLLLHRSVTDHDIAALCQRYAYLQILNPEALEERIYEPASLPLNTGWLLADYGDAMTATPRTPFLGSSNQDDEDDSGGSIPRGNGTHILQMVNTAHEMIAIAVAKGWSGVEIYAGEKIMRWAAWVAAEDIHFPVTGFTPSTEDHEKRNRIRRMRSESGITDTLAPTAP